MTVVLRASLLTVFFCLQAVSQQHAQQVPGENHQGNPVSIIRNDANDAITIEVRNYNQWQAVKIDANKDVSISGDHIRVATTRPDGAEVAIQFPIQGGKKYRVFWNAQALMWDVVASR